MGKTVRSYWGQAIALAARGAFRKSPQQIVAQALTFLIAVLLLRTIFGPAADVQVTEEVRWVLAAVGAFVVMSLGSFLVQLALVPPQLQESAVLGAVAVDRATRKRVRDLVLDRRLNEGAALRQRIAGMKGHWSTPGLVEIVGDIRRWQSRTLRSVQRCDAGNFSRWRADAGNVLPDGLTWLLGRDKVSGVLDDAVVEWMRAIAALQHQSSSPAISSQVQT